MLFCAYVVFKFLIFSAFHWRLCYIGPSIGRSVDMHAVLFYIMSAKIRCFEGIYRNSVHQRKKDQRNLFRIFYGTFVRKYTEISNSVGLPKRFLPF